MSSAPAPVGQDYSYKASVDIGALLYLAYLLLNKIHYNNFNAVAGFMIGESRMKRLIPLSILVSTLLTGCGAESGVDGGGSGSGTSPQPSQNITFEFVQLRPVSEAPSETCTFFDGTGQNSDAKTYGKVASDVMVKVYHADGTFDKTLSVSSNGVLKFAISDVEDGGYVSVIDSPGSSDHLYKVLSIQKELLGNYLINVDRNQGNVACYEGGKGLITGTGYPLLTNSDDVTADGHGYETSHSSIGAQNQRRVKVEAYSNERILEKAYHVGALVGYVFTSGLTSEPTLTDTKLKEINETLAWNNHLANNELQKLGTRLVDGNFSYPWYQPLFNTTDGSTTAFPYVGAESDWFYSAEGKTATNWNFVLNDTFSASLDVKLPDSLTLNDTSPTITQVGNAFVFQAPGVSSTEKLVQRSYYSQSGSIKGKPTTLDHSIYSIADSNGDVIIPDLELSELDPVGQDSISVAVIEAATRNDELIESFMRSYQGSDLVSVVLTPADRIAHQKVINMSDYTLVER